MIVTAVLLLVSALCPLPVHGNLQYNSTGGDHHPHHHHHGHQCIHHEIIQAQGEVGNSSHIVSWQGEK